MDELDKEISRLKLLKEEYFNLEQSIKIFINSIYGGVGSPYFECYNVALAEAVTLQGQDMIKYANTIIDDYLDDLATLYTHQHNLHLHIKTIIFSILLFFMPKLRLLEA